MAIGYIVAGHFQLSGGDGTSAARLASYYRGDRNASPSCRGHNNVSHHARLIVVGRAILCHEFDHGLQSGWPISNRWHLHCETEMTDLKSYVDGPVSRIFFAA